MTITWNDDVAKVAMPALLGLFGTILGLWLGQRRWYSELQMKKRRAFDARRYEAYTDLWKVVETAHITIRTGRPDVDEVRKLEQQINVFRYENAILLDSSDSDLAIRYFDRVVNLSKVIADSGSRELETQFEKTADRIPVHGVQKLYNANEDASKLRAELIARIKAVMLETSYAVTPA